MDFLSYSVAFANARGLVASPLPGEALTVIKPHLLAFEAKSAVVFLAPYYSGEREHNISLYAVPRDYHLFWKGFFSEMLTLLAETFPATRAAAFADHSPIDERRAAASASLGVLGDNGMLINREYGSYVFIGEVLFDDSPGNIPYIEPESCIHCGRCAAACPAGCVGGEKRLCLSSLTQKKGELAEDERRAVAGSGCAWGCDICQTVCPLNEQAKQTQLQFFREALISSPRAREINEMTDEEFSARAYSWRGRQTIIRNLKIIEDSKNDLQNS